MNAEEMPASSGRAFIVGAFVVASIVGVVVGYLGVTGRLGGPIP